MRPESLMMSHGHSAKLAQGSVKTPIHQTSTFAFETAEEGKAYFELAYGLRKPDVDETMGFIYSRISNPTLEVLEQRLCLWDQAADCAAFSSGMAAISNVLLTFLKPGDLLVFSNPVYGGTDHFIRQYLPGIGVNVLDIHPQESIEQIKTRINESGHADRLAMIFLETPANPTNDLYDIDALHQLAQRYSNADKKVLLAVDNTYMGPLWQHPLQHGADLVIYSATKYIGGHSDVIAGAVLGSTAHIQEVKGLRAFLGNMASPHTCWLLLRSLETLKVRMEQQARTAAQLALYLGNHPLVDKTYYLGDLEPCDDGYEVFKKQLLSPGAMISFDILGGEKEAFIFLNNLHLVKLAVSLGSTESLAQHPATMTHAGVDPEDRLKFGIGDNMIRLSVGLEHAEDLIADLDHAFNEVDAYISGSRTRQEPNTPHPAFVS